MSGTQIDTTTFELGEAKLALRDDLRFSVQGSRVGEQAYLIEDKATGDFYRVGQAEYTFISLLDGQTTLATAVARTCSLVGRDAFNEEDASGICKWLVDSGLAATRASTSARRIDRKRKEAQSQQLTQKLNPISIRIPLFNPSRFVRFATRYTAWAFTIPIGIVWLVVCGWALLELCMNAGTVASHEIQVFSRDNMFWLGVVWVLLKLVHETGHAVACRRFGGSVRKCGVLLLLLIPLPFVDVTSSWRFGNKYHRMIVSAAGMLIELFLAAIATLVWLRVDPGMVSQQAMNVMLAASVNTLLFNANPLMKFDGYHILSDWLEIPNLAKHGNAHVMGVMRKHLLGVSGSRLPWSGFRGRFIKFYGFAAIVWKVLICISLVLAASNLLPGFGFLIAALAFGLWLALPVIKFAKYLWRGTEYEQPHRLRFGIIIASVCLIGGVLGSALPSPSVISAPIVIDYKPMSIVRAETSGFVKSVHVHPGQQVAAGSMLLELENPELELQLREVESRILQTKLRAANRQKLHQVSAWQLEQETLTALSKQRDGLQQRVAGLTVKAPTAGEVIADSMRQLVGTYVHPGDKLLSIGDNESKEAIALVSQRDGRHLIASEGEEVEMRIWGEFKLSPGKIREISPRQQTQPPHFAFAGVYGGPLAVVERAQYEQAAPENVDPEDASQLSLLEPRLAVRIGMDPATCSQLRSGQCGIVYLRMRETSIGPYLYENISAWLKRQVHVSHGL
jgi:putative peptide zinc metalloprotease protein